MNRILQFAFRPGVPLAETEMSLHLAMFAVEGLIGRVRVSLDANYVVDDASRAILIDEGNLAGWLIARVFAGLLVREFGENAFEVVRVHVPQTRTTRSQPQEICA